MKLIAVLCPGPSLLDTWCDDCAEEFDEVLAVNTAGWVFGCDWLGFVDKHVIEPFLRREKTPPRKGFITHENWAPQLRGVGLSSIRPRMYFESHVKPDSFVNMDSSRCAYTFPNVLDVAMQHAGEGGGVHVFGMDFSGARVDAGGNHIGDHGRLRWMQEAQWLRAIWRADIVVSGTISHELLAYIRGTADTLPGLHC